MSRCTCDRQRVTFRQWRCDFKFVVNPNSLWLFFTTSSGTAFAHRPTPVPYVCSGTAAAGSCPTSEKASSTRSHKGPSRRSAPPAL